MRVMPVTHVVLLLALAAALPSCGAPSASPVVASNRGAREGAPSSPKTSAPRCLSIAAWNDMHGQLAPDEVQVDATRVPAGGVVAMADQIAELRETGDAVVTLDAGDLFTGPLDSTLAEGAPIIDAYDVMGVDAVAIGNHEFDFGPVGYARVIAPPGVGDEAGESGPRGALFARMEAARFPFLSANLQRSDGRALGWPSSPGAPGVHASTRIARAGFDVGVVGYTTIDTPLTTLKPNVIGLDFKTLAAARVAAEVHALRAAGAAPVVLLAHASLDGELPQRMDDPLDPEGSRRVGEIASLLDAMPASDRPDVIVAGHRHAWMLGRVRGVPIVSSDQHGVGLARIRYCRASSSAPPVLERIERRVAMAASPPSSALGVRVASVVLPWQAKVKAEADAIVATLPRTCVANALNGTAMAEQTARAIAEHATVALPAPRGVPIVAIMNSGGIRAPLHAGPVRYRDLFTASPFENGVAVCATTRAGLARAIANALHRPSVREHFPFGIAGAKVTMKRGADGDLTLVRLDVEKSAAVPKDDDPIWLAIPDFILWGGDGLLDGVTCTSAPSSPVRVRDVWRAVLAREQMCDGAPRNIAIDTR